MRPLSSPGSLHTTLRAAVPTTLRTAAPTVSRAPLGVLAALLALAVLLGPASATAQPHGTVVPTDTAAHSAGMRYLEAGVAAASAQRFAEAAASFEQAFALLGDIEISYNVGAMRERAGDVAGALRAYERFLAAAPPASVAPGLRAHVEDLRATVNTVTVPVPQAHAVTPLVEVLPTEPPTTIPGAPHSLSRAPSRVGPIVLLGTGGAALLAAGVFAGLRSSALSACEVSPNGDVARCPTAEARDTASAAPTWALGANLAAGVGVAALAAGALWWALTPAHSEGPPPPPTVTVSAGPSGVVVAGRF